MIERNRHDVSCHQNWLTLPSWSANFDDTAPNAVSSRLSGLSQLGKLFVFPLMTNSVFERLTGLEPPFNGISEFICELLDVMSER